MSQSVRRGPRVLVADQDRASPFAHPAIGKLWIAERLARDEHLTPDAFAAAELLSDSEETKTPKETKKPEKHEKTKKPEKPEKHEKTKKTETTKEPKKARQGGADSSAEFAAVQAAGEVPVRYLRRKYLARLIAPSQDTSNSEPLKPTSSWAEEGFPQCDSVHTWVTRDPAQKTVFWGYDTTPRCFGDESWFGRLLESVGVDAHRCLSVVGVINEFKMHGVLVTMDEVDFDTDLVDNPLSKFVIRFKKPSDRVKIGRPLKPRNGGQTSAESDTDEPPEPDASSEADLAKEACAETEGPGAKSEVKMYSAFDEELRIETLRQIAEQRAANPELKVPLVCGPDFKRLRYKASQFATLFSRALHWGQRKLMLSEIEFLTIYYQQPPKKRRPFAKVVYVGAAPGHHIPYTMKLFPDTEWYLYDPAPFDRQVHEEARRNPRLKFFNQFFTDDDAKAWDAEQPKYKNADILYICDIRSIDEELRQTTVAGVAQNMDWQQAWYYAMNPHMSLLKFRLPWEPGTTAYVKGDIYFQAWSRLASTESRLLIWGAHQPKHEYDNIEYEEQFRHFNVVTRCYAKYKSPFSDELLASAHMENCYDTHAELRILMDWFKTLAAPPLVELDKKGRKRVWLSRVLQMSRELTAAIGMRRGLQLGSEIHATGQHLAVLRFLIENKHMDASEVDLLRATTADFHRLVSDNPERRTAVLHELVNYKEYSDPSLYRPENSTKLVCEFAVLYDRETKRRQKENSTSRATDQRNVALREGRVKNSAGFTRRR